MADYAELIGELYLVASQAKSNNRRKLLERAADAIEHLVSVAKQQEVELVEMTGELASKTTYSELYEELTDKGIKTIRELLDNFPKWIPVTERLPELHEEVLVCNGEYGLSGLGFAAVAVWDGTDWIETWDRRTAIHCVTNWMPLPKPPKDANDG